MPPRRRLPRRFFDLADQSRRFEPGRAGRGGRQRGRRRAVLSHHRLVNDASGDGLWQARAVEAGDAGGRTRGREQFDSIFIRLKSLGLRWPKDPNY